MVIVDLKTGKREPQTDAKVIDNPQLGAYQLAFESGAIPAAAGRPPGGAKLLVLRPTAARSDYATPWQPPFDDERRELFLDAHPLGRGRHARHLVHRAVRRSLPRRVLVRALPHPHDRCGERVVTASRLRGHAVG